MTMEAAVWRMKQEQARALSLAWHIAALQRQKKMPSLARLLAALKPREDVPIQERRKEFEELKARMMPRRNENGR
jgi:hypothetical protein